MSQTLSGQWSYPLEETNGNVRRPMRRNDTGGSQEGRPGGYAFAKTVRRTPSDLHVMSDTEEVKQRRVSLKASNASAGRKRARNGLGQATPEGPVDDSAWIHRDKLAQIEIQEMEDAGIYVRPSRRSMSAEPGASGRSSRSASRARRPMSMGPDEPVPVGSFNAAYGSYEENEHRYTPTTPTALGRGEDFDPDVDTEFRTPEEVAAEHGSIRSNVLRPTTSRIPISKASAVPVPSNVIGRDSPLPRSRHGSSAGSGNWDEMQYARRARSASMGSQAILDEDGVRTPPASGSSQKQTSSDNSPPKAKVPAKTAPKSSGRKGSTPNETSRPGSSAGARKASTPSQRPGSRAGSAQKSGRPSTSHQQPPEGEAPWIESMYKPDPRLPPDQQMLPTHAKRMMQEQWEREGKSGTAYDRDLNLLNNKEFPSPKLKPQPNLSPADRQRTPSESPSRLGPAAQQAVELPTSPDSTRPNPWASSPRDDKEVAPPPSPRPGTSGGLKLTPNVPTPPPIQRSPTAQLSSAQQSQVPNRRVPDLDEKDEAQQKKGGCACCVVM